MPGLTITKLTRRTVASPINPTPEQMLKRDGLQTLRIVTAHKPEPAWNASFEKICSAVASFIFAFRPAPRNSMCHYYGHTIDGHWSDGLPTCADCGKKIRGPEQLRKPTPVFAR